MVNDDDLIYEKKLSGKSLIKDILDTDNISPITDDTGKSYWWNTIDESKEYLVKKYEYYRNFQPCSWTYYRIKEL